MMMMMMMIVVVMMEEVVIRKELNEDLDQVGSNRLLTPRGLPLQDFCEAMSNLTGRFLSSVVS
jgi:hypothetical protein